MQANVEFQFTHPGRGATPMKMSWRFFPEFQFTHPGRGATLNDYKRGLNVMVSIHAPREGCD